MDPAGCPEAPASLNVMSSAMKRRMFGPAGRGGVQRLTPGRWRPPGAGGADRSGLRGEQGVDGVDAGRVPPGTRLAASSGDCCSFGSAAARVEESAIVVALEALVERVARRGGPRTSAIRSG